MSENVIALNGGPVPGEPDPFVVEMLERVLAQAKAGEVTGIAFVMWRRDGRWQEDGAGSYSLMQAMGCVEILKDSLKKAYYKSEGEG